MRYRGRLFCRESAAPVEVEIEEDVFFDDDDDDRARAAELRRRIPGFLVEDRPVVLDAAFVMGSSETMALFWDGRFCCMVMAEDQVWNMAVKQGEALEIFSLQGAVVPLTAESVRDAMRFWFRRSFPDLPGIERVEPTILLRKDTC